MKRLRPSPLSFPARSSSSFLISFLISSSKHFFRTPRPPSRPRSRARTRPWSFATSYETRERGAYECPLRKRRVALNQTDRKTNRNRTTATTPPLPLFFSSFFLFSSFLISSSNHFLSVRQEMGVTAMLALLLCCATRPGDRPAMTVRRTSRCGSALCACDTRRCGRDAAG